jgi:hypothetical protein
MGQKSNPNSFQKQSLNAKLWSTQSKKEYSLLLKNDLEIKENIRSLFERNNCLVKECMFLRSKETNFGTLFISFLPMLLRKKNVEWANNSLGTAKIVNLLFNLIANFGYPLEKRIVFLNLDHIGSKTKKKFQNSESLKTLFIFKNEIFYTSGLTIFFLLFSVKNMTPLLTKYIARYFKLLHRTKKINKFLLFLSRFVTLVEKSSFCGSRIKGVKLQIKGRFNGVPRSKTRVFEKGRIPLQTIASKINYSLCHVNTSYGVFSIKVWLYD